MVRGRTAACSASLPPRSPRTSRIRTPEGGLRILGALCLSLALACASAGGSAPPADPAGNADPTASAPGDPRAAGGSAAPSAPETGPDPQAEEASAQGDGLPQGDDPLADAPDPTDPTADPTDPADPADPNAASGGRAQSAVEGLLMGAIIGGQLGPIGAAVGGLTVMVYGAITGDVPFQGPRTGVPGGGGGRPGGPTPREEELEEEIEKEIARQDSLEDAIEAELKRQEELLEQIERDEALREAEQAQPAGAQAGVQTEGEGASRELPPEQETDPRAAPRVPPERDLPVAIFDEERRMVREGQWGNEERIEVLRRSLDADRDGAPEEVRYHDPKSGVILRKETDEDYDGTLDTFTSYESGIPVRIVRDTSGDGRIDEWETYGRDGRMARREVDRSGNGEADAIYLFEGDSLVEERHDTNSNGEVDRVVHYQDRRILRTEEDTDRDGQVDTWTFFRGEPGQERVDRVERDTSGDGKADTFETYELVAGKPTLKQRDEDRNGDGQIDVKSIYENGKLKQREIQDPALMPL